MGQGTLTINSIAMTGPAWEMDDLSSLWAPPALRGQSVTIPGTPGRVAQPRYVDETTHQLPMKVMHGFNHSGTPYATHEDGLRQNLAYLWEHVLDPTIATTVTASLLLPDGSTTVTAAVQPALSDPGRVQDHLGILATRYVLYLTVPAGKFA